MPDLTPQEEGRAYEERFAESIGAVPVKGSGAFFSKLDVRGVSVLWSCKWAGRHKSFRVTEDHIQEAVSAIYGPGGIGGDSIPAMAIQTENEELAVIRMSDLIAMLTGDVEIATAKSQGYVRRDTTPELLR